MSEIVLECKNLNKSYQSGQEVLEILKSINLTISQGDSIAIVGASGAGKSTLLNLLGGLDLPTTGTARLKDNDYATLNDNDLSRLRNRELGFVYQFHHLLAEFSALENVAMPLLIAGQSRKDAYVQAEAMLEKVGLKKRAGHRPAQLSGGERQRVAIARALVNSPSCVLMDEPTGNLDEATAQQVQGLLKELNESLGICFVIVTHDKKVAASQKKVLLLQDGGLQEMVANEIV